MLRSVRVLWRRPGFAVAAATTLALGLGANMAMFSAVRAVLIEDGPYPDTQQLVTLLPADHMRGIPFGPADVEVLGRLPAFSSVAGCGAPDVLSLSSRPSVLAAAMGVTQDFFKLLAVAPQSGRVLIPSDFAPGVRNAVVSFDLWRTMLAADPDAIGRSIVLNRESWTVVGIMPRAFAPACFESDSAEAWIPLRSTVTSASAQFGLVVTARLASDVAVSSAQTQVDTLTTELMVQRNDSRYQHAYLEPLGASKAEGLKPGLLMLQAVAVVLLLIACANLANLFLVSTTDRHNEFAMRATLGASPYRLAGQVMAEAVVIATTGAAAGAVVAFWTSSWLGSLAGRILATDAAFRVDLPDLAVGLGAGWVTAVFFGTVPAMLAARIGTPAMGRSTRTSSAGRTIRRVRETLVCVQVLLAVVLLTGSALLLHSFVRVMSVPVGFDARGVVTTEVHLPTENGTVQAERFQALLRRLDNELARSAGLQQRAFSDSPPFSGGAGVRWALRPPGASESTRYSFSVKRVSPDYFSVLGLATLRGLTFREVTPMNGSLPALVSDDFVQRFGQGRDLLGAVVDSPDGSFTIVGVVGGVRTTRVTDSPRPVLYVPIESTASRHISVLLRTTDSASATRTLQDVVRQVDPNGPAVAVESLDAIVWRSEERRRFYLVVVALLGGLASAVAVGGVFGAVARNTSLRSRELGIRLALGASPGRLVARATAEGMFPVVAGCVGGLVGAWWAGALLETNALFRSLMFEVGARDPWVFTLVPCAVLVASALASWMPARLIAQTDPGVVLKDR